MKATGQGDRDWRSSETKLRVVMAIAVLLGLAAVFTGMPAIAGEEATEDSNREGYESRIYGTVEKAPPGKIGLWAVNRREVKVSNSTRIIEKHGKAEVGAYVEVEGNNTGRTFSASRIEVKRAKLK